MKHTTTVLEALPATRRTTENQWHARAGLEFEKA